MFQLGQVFMTAGVNNKVANDGTFSKFVFNSIRRYVHGDWGNLCKKDKAMNDSAVKNGDDRIFAKYTNEKGVSIYIITALDRSATTILFPEEY